MTSVTSVQFLNKRFRNNFILQSIEISYSVRLTKHSSTNFKCMSPVMNTHFRFHLHKTFFFSQWEEPWKMSFFAWTSRGWGYLHGSKFPSVSVQLRTDFPCYFRSVWGFLHHVYLCIYFVVFLLLFLIFFSIRLWAVVYLIVSNHFVLVEGTGLELWVALRTSFSDASGSGWCVWIAPYTQP